MWDNIRKMSPIERRPDGELFRLTPKQARSVRRLVKLCCNNMDGDCLLLDDGESCVCPQSIAYTLICKYFRHAVLPAEPELEDGIFQPKDMRRCTLCGTRYIAGSGRSKYCPDCAAKVHRKQKAAHARKKRSSVDNYPPSKSQLFQGLPDAEAKMISHECRKTRFNLSTGYVLYRTGSSCRYLV